MTIDDDLMANNTVVTGYIFAALALPRGDATARATIVQLGNEGDFDLEPNQLAIRVPIARSAYRITVELIPGTDLEEVEG